MKPMTAKKWFNAWLISAIVLLIIMITVGGITRLTDSGLSIVSWKPISGVLPPLTTEAWQGLFDEYKQFPEYQLKNMSMTLKEFKFIFFWEYLHRMIGRLLGLWFLIPFLIFWRKGVLSHQLKKRLFGVFILGGLQGLAGWYMVKSGLVDIPEVSHLRLALHFFLAFTIVGLIAWIWMEENKQEKQCTSHAGLYQKWKIGLGLLSVQVIYGALTAGLKAGYLYNTWPKMGSEWVPDAIWMMSPMVKNVVDNPFMVQFVHRYLAWGVALMLIWTMIETRKEAVSTFQKKLAHSVVVLVFIQIILGIVTLLTKVHLHVAVTHQFIAIFLWIITVAVTFSFKATKT